VLIEQSSRVSVPAAPRRAPRDAEAFALVVTAGESPGRHIAIGTAPIIIGRGVGADLQIRDPTVSRHHCVVWRATGRCWVRDLGSTNQTRVNNRCAPMAELAEGDVLLVGQTALMLTRARCCDERSSMRQQPR
jgi:pSer/pThr/pTyr-binding forkhead associated (FHA) protein